MIRIIWTIQEYESNTLLSVCGSIASVLEYFRQSKRNAGEGGELFVVSPMTGEKKPVTEESIEKFLTPSREMMHLEDKDGNAIFCLEPWEMEMEVEVKFL